jgi:hypothetical protein
MTTLRGQCSNKDTLIGLLVRQDAGLMKRILTIDETRHSTIGGTVVFVVRQNFFVSS